MSPLQPYDRIQIKSIIIIVTINHNKIRKTWKCMKIKK